MSGLPVKLKDKIYNLYKTAELYILRLMHPTFFSRAEDIILCAEFVVMVYASETWAVRRVNTRSK